MDWVWVTRCVQPVRLTLKCAGLLISETLCECHNIADVRQNTSLLKWSSTPDLVDRLRLESTHVGRLGFGGLDFAQHARWSEGGQSLEAFCGKGPDSIALREPATLLQKMARSSGMLMRDVRAGTNAQ